MSSYCIDTSVFIKYLCPDEQEGAATELVGRALSGRIVLPCFAWAEIASVLRKKIRSGLLTEGEAGQLYSAFGELPIDYVDGEDIPELPPYIYTIIAENPYPSMDTPLNLS